MPTKYWNNLLCIRLHYVGRCMSLKAVFMLFGHFRVAYILLSVVKMSQFLPGGLVYPVPSS